MRRISISHPFPHALTDSHGNDDLWHEDVSVAGVAEQLGLVFVDGGRRQPLGALKALRKQR